MVQCVYDYLLMQHQKWQKMSKRPDAELVVEHIAYDHTINYVDNTIVILNASNGIVAK